jgi:hypothetical protein
VLRRIFGPERVQVVGGWGKLYNEELHNLCSSPNVIRMIKSRRMRWAGHLACMRTKRNTFRILLGKPKANIPPGRIRCRWDDNIRMDLPEIGWGGMDWIHLS